MNGEEEKQIKSLILATFEDFRGFIIDGERLNVADDELHALVALKELENYPGWKYEHGVGRDAIAELLYLRKAIYLTRIKIGEGEYQRTIAYCKDVYSQSVKYKGSEQTLANVIKSLALGDGYEVDEYEITDKENYKFKVTNYIAQIDYKQREGKRFHQSFSEGDKPIFVGDKYIGFIHNGKFYSSKPQSNKSEQEENQEGR